MIIYLIDININNEINMICKKGIVSYFCKKNSIETVIAKRVKIKDIDFELSESISGSNPPMIPKINPIIKFGTVAVVKISGAVNALLNNIDVPKCTLKFAIYNSFLKLIKFSRLLQNYY